LTEDEWTRTRRDLSSGSGLVSSASVPPLSKSWRTTAFTGASSGFKPPFGMEAYVVES
jgi:hypothetical protein